MGNERINLITAIAKAISDETRVRMLMALRGRELCVCQLQAMVDLAPSSVSEHLAQLRQARLVASRKQGRWVYYKLASRDAGKHVCSVLQWLDQNLSTEAQILTDEMRLQQILNMRPEELCSPLAAS